MKKPLKKETLVTLNAMVDWIAVGEPRTSIHSKNIKVITSGKFSDEFWPFWHANKPELVKAGYRVTSFGGNGWIVQHIVRSPKPASQQDTRSFMDKITDLRKALAASRLRVSDGR